MEKRGSENSPEKPSLKSLFLFSLKLGFISFGGPAGQIAIMNDQLVDKKKWISNSRFLHALNYCMILPGPEAQQLATYLGWLLYGIKGGLIAGILFVLPSMLILLCLCIVYVSFGQLPWVYAFFEGLRPAVIAVVLHALYRIGRKSLKSAIHYAIAVAGFVCIFFFNIPFPLIILGAILVGIVLSYGLPQQSNSKKSSEKGKTDNERLYYISEHSPIQQKAFSLKTIALKILVSALFWILPLCLFFILGNHGLFWRNVSIFFTEAALVTFGGAYAVLPYVAQVAVENYHWLSKLEMMDGLALGETTPGPLIMVLAFVGFMAGFHFYEGHLALGAIALLVTTYYTFLPCFLFIFIGAPIIERTKENPFIKHIFPFVTSAVVGVILNLTIYLGKTALFPDAVSLSDLDWVNLIWLSAAFTVLVLFKRAMIPIIIVSGLFGVFRFFISF